MRNTNNGEHNKDGRHTRNIKLKAGWRSGWRRDLENKSRCLTGGVMDLYVCGRRERRRRCGNSRLRDCVHLVAFTGPRYFCWTSSSQSGHLSPYASTPISPSPRRNHNQPTHTPQYKEGSRDRGGTFWSYSVELLDFSVDW